MEPLSKQLPAWLTEQSKSKKAKGAVDSLVPNLVRRYITFLSCPSRNMTLLQVEIIFGNTKELYKMHKGFYESLQYAIKNWYPYCKVGTLFTDVVRSPSRFPLISPASLLMKEAFMLSY